MDSLGSKGLGIDQESSDVSTLSRCEYSKRAHAVRYPRYGRGDESVAFRHKETLCFLQTIPNLSVRKRGLALRARQLSLVHCPVPVPTSRWLPLDKGPGRSHSDIGKEVSLQNWPKLHRIISLGCRYEYGPYKPEQKDDGASRMI